MVNLRQQDYSEHSKTREIKEDKYWKVHTVYIPQ
jgi:hypothetical protein